MIGSRIDGPDPGPRDEAGGTAGEALDRSDERGPRADAAGPVESAVTPSGGDPSGADEGRRSFFRSFSKDTLQATATVVGMATAFQRGTGQVLGQLLGLGAQTDLAGPGGAADPEALTDPPVPPAPAYRSPYRFAPEEMRFVDQRRLPEVVDELTCHTGAEVAGVIRERIVPGGPVLGQVAAYGLALTAERMSATTPFMRSATLKGTMNALRTGRPASRAIEWALERLSRAWDAVGELSEGRLIADALRAEAEAIENSAMTDHAAIGRAGAAVLPRPFERHLEILVHGPVGPLAGGAIGTALAVVHELVADGRPIHVWVTEGRPSFHGARVTAWELGQADIPHTVIADAAAPLLMSHGRVDAVLVGAERIAVNGDTCAALGTYALAAVAARHSIPLYVCAPLATVDPNLVDGLEIGGEERPASELTDIGGTRVPPVVSGAFNPTVDITPGPLVAGFVTESGVLAQPYVPWLRAALLTRHPSLAPSPVPGNGDADDGTTVAPTGPDPGAGSSGPPAADPATGAGSGASS